MKAKLPKLLALCTLLIGLEARASKFDLMMGMFSLDATSSSGDTSVSSLGAYRAAFSHSLLDNVDVMIGYTLNMTNTVGGDLAYGMDLGFNYFPLTFTEPKSFEKDGVRIRRDELWRPYVGMSFNQRQFQSVRNNYAGFGVNVGTEYSLNKKFSFKSEFRYISLGGSGDSEATEMNVLAGISLNF